MVNVSAPFVSKVKRQVLLVVVTLLIWLIPTPLILILLVPSLIYRTLVILLARLTRPDLSHIFGGKASCFAQESLQTRPKLSILLHFIFDGPLPLEKLRALLEQRVINDVDEAGNLRYPHLRQYWTQFMGFLFWKWDKSFHLDNHVKLLADLKLFSLPSPCEDDLKSVTSELLARPYAVNRSPWEAFLVPGYRSSDNNDGREQTAIVLRLHHSMADGYSVLGILLKLTQQTDDAPLWRIKFPEISRARRIMLMCLAPLKLPWDAANLIANSYDPVNAWRLDTKLERKYYTFVSDAIKVDDIKRIRNKFRVGYNVAAYAATAGAVKRLMQEAGIGVPDRISCFLPFPLPRHPGGLAFHVSGVYFKFSPTLMTPVERLMEISSNINEISSSSTGPFALALLGEILGLMPVWVTRTLASKMRVSLSMTSFPGPETELNIMDTKARLVDIIPALGHPAGQLGMTAVLVSFAGRQRVVLTVDRKIFANSKVPQRFAQYLNEEISALLNHVQDSEYAPMLAV